MIVNRSVPRATVVPVLTYDDVVKASAWLCGAFGFTERLRIATHRVQLTCGDGAVILTARRGPAPAAASPSQFVHINVRVFDADAHMAQAAKHGARILQPPTDYPYGERQYTAEDLGGHQWVFSQSIADVAPEQWGGTSVNLG